MESSSPEQRRQIGNYTLYLDEELGSGAFAHVYLAKDNRNSKYVAVKEFTDEKTFHCEAKILKQLRDQAYHPHILSYIDQVGYKPEPYYIVVELARGGTLKEYLASLKTKPIEFNQALTIIKQIGKAVSFIHEQNILHCDITPQNILFDDFSHTNAVLADFGIAVELNSGDNSISIPESRGDRLYMAPERFNETATKRSDQYSLGCIAYELFTGRHPLKDINTPINVDSNIKRQLEEVKVGLKDGFRDLKEALPPFIEEAILKSLSIQSDERYKDVDLFLRAIEHLEEKTPYDLYEQTQEEPSTSDQDTKETLDDLRLSGPLQTFIDALKNITFPIKEGTLIAGSTGRERQYHYIVYNNSFRKLIYIPQQFFNNLIDLRPIEMVLEDFAHPDTEFLENGSESDPNTLSQVKLYILVFSTISYIDRAHTRIMEKERRGENGMRVEFVPWGHVNEFLKELIDIDKSISERKEMRKRKVIEDILKISRKD